MSSLLPEARLPHEFSESEVKAWMERQYILYLNDCAESRRTPEYSTALAFYTGHETPIGENPFTYARFIMANVEALLNDPEFQREVTVVLSDPEIFPERQN